jgi:hypothetical protein
MKRNLLVWSVGILWLTAPAIGRAQNLEERLKQFADEFAKGYTAPFTDAFGAAMNSGWYHTADVSDGLDLFIGVKFMVMPIPSSAKKFKTRSIWNNTEQEVPTVFGEETEVGMSGAPTGATPANYPKGFNVGFVPMVVPHASAGNIFGTRVMLRYLPKVKLGDYGEFEFFGIGAQHSISQYIPLVPLDISALVAYQSLTLGSLVSASAVSVGVQASKSFVLITVYGGLGYETSTMEFTYRAQFTDPANPGQQISKDIKFEADGKNNFRATVGVALNLGLVKVSADYSLASQSVATLGVGFGW